MLPSPSSHWAVIKVNEDWIYAYASTQKVDLCELNPAWAT